MPVNFAQMRLLFCLALVVVCCVPAVTVVAQTTDRLTPIQREIEKQRQRLASAEVDERRDALMRLGNLHRPDASRAAAAGLNDAVAAVRVAAAHAIVSLPPDEAAHLLLPLLQDKLEFIRREAAYALGETRSRSAVSALVNSLTTDKEMSIRAAAAIALGEIGDGSAVPALSQVLTDAPTGKKKSKRQPDPFVMRAAARSLGQIHSASSVNVLIATLSNETNSSDVRREAATALGMIGDSAAIPALRNAFASDDPYLSEAAWNALRKMHVAVKN
jgi:HEAT repeat protein